MDLEGIILSEISQRKTNTVWYHLPVESKRGELTEAGSRLVGPGAERWGKRGDVGQSINFQLWDESGNLMYTMVVIVNNILLYSWKLLSIDIKSSPHKKEMVIMWRDGGVS